MATTIAFRLYYCLLYFLTSCECFVNKSVIYNSDYVPRVVNGRPAKLGDVPYQVAFKMLVNRQKKLYQTYCGGTIIGPTKLISAAHCFEVKGSKCKTSLMKKVYADRRHLKRTQVVAGNLWNDARYNPGAANNGQWRQLESMAYPGRYRFPNHDISAGYTTKAFDFNENVKPVKNIESVFVDTRPRTCLVSGYGRINKYQLSDKLLLADLVMIGSRACSRIHRRKMDRFICTQSVPSDVEKGDSGGPLVCGNTLVGVVSGHRERAGSFFTRVSAYIDFVKDSNIDLRSNFTTVFLYPVYVILKFYYYSDC